ncbi:MAG: hypothetical protein R8P61_10710 [Bacteroidia bacterium]|nr:hypothetical protein [Bacteroidia bacterium]
MATYDGNPQDYEGIIQSGYEFRLGDYLSRGWELFKENAGGFIGYIIIYIILSMIISTIAQMLGFGNAFLSFILGQVAAIPTVGLGAGFILVAHRIAQNQEVEFGNFFDGLKDMVQLWLGNLVAGWLAALPMLIGVYLAVGSNLFEWIADMQNPMAFTENSEDFMAQLTTMGPKIAMYGGLGLVLTIVISTLYSFTQPNILFGRLKFWDAMEVSRKIVSQKVLSFILLMLVLIGSIAVGMGVLGFIAGASGNFLVIAITVIAGLAGMLIYVGFVYCVNYAVYEDIVLKNMDGTMEERIDEIGE